MKNRILPFFIIIFLFCAKIQFIYAQWNSYFSYNNVTAITSYNSNVYVGDNISFFKYNLENFDKQLFSSVNNFDAYEISSILFSDVHNRLVIGNSNGLITVYNPKQDLFSTVSGIVNTATVLASQKKINSISEFDSGLYLATDYGITELFLENNLLGDTFYIGNAGEPIAVLKVLKYNGYIYAITRTNGIKSAISNSNLLSYQNWSTIDWGYWKDGVVFNDKLIIADTNGNLAQFSSPSTHTVFNNIGESIVSIKNIENTYLLVAGKNSVKIFDTALNVIKSFNFPNWTIKDITLVNNKLFVGTTGNGTQQVDINSAIQENITPSGPERNNIFKLKYDNTNLWAVYGDYTIYYNPYPLDYYGISLFNKATGWKNYSNTQILNSVSVVTIQPHPINKNKVFFGSFYSGVLENSNLTDFTLYNQTSTGTDGLQGIYPNQDIRVGAIAFDSEQNMWVANSRVSRPLVVMKKDGTWINYSLNNVLAISAPDENYGSIVIDKNNTKWLGTFYSGIIGFNEKQNRYVRINASTAGTSLPVSDVRSLALDHNDQLWIGTSQGLRISSSVNRFYEDNTLSVNPIIFDEDGVAQELFSNQNIRDIEVDGSNNKWISILGAGVFHVSSDGQKVLNRFTVDNSPLPSNNVNDIEINGDTGEVFFATEKGLYSFKGDATSANDNLNDVYIYPNPVRPGYDGDVKISGLMRDAIVKITDISGNLVFETTATGGTVLWNQQAFNKHKVASGVYMVFITHVEQKVNKTKKIMIIR